MKIEVINTGKEIEQYTNAVLLDLGILLPDEFKLKSYHCVFIKDFTNMKIINVNSWGEYDPIEVREVSKDSKAIHSYLTVNVKELIYKGDENLGDIKILRHDEKHGY